MHIYIYIDNKMVKKIDSSGHTIQNSSAGMSKLGVDSVHPRGGGKKQQLAMEFFIIMKKNLKTTVLC